MTAAVTLTVMATNTLLPAHIVERTRALIRKLLSEGWTQTTIARKLGISQAAISSALNPRKGGGLKPQNAIAIYTLAGEDTSEITRALTGQDRTKVLAPPRNLAVTSSVPGGEGTGERLAKQIKLQAAIQAAAFPGLEVCLLNHPPGTWSDATIAACRHGAWPDDVEAWEWPARLDRYQTLMGGVTISNGAAGARPKRLSRES